MGNVVDELHRPRYRLLGPVAVHDAGGALPIGALKQRTALAALLLRANQVVAEEELFDLVWGDETPPSVRGRLQVYISELRGVLGRDVIARVGGGYRLAVAGGELDLQLFTDSVATARDELRDDRPRPAARRLRDALALWDGPALGGVTESLALQERPGLEERRLVALEELFDAELADGRHDQVAWEIRKASAENPFRERFTAQLMLALHRGGRTPDALRLYAETHRRLADELGIEPSRKLRELQTRILSGEPAAPRRPSREAPAPAPAREDPGPVRPRELPRDVHGFTGRDELMAALDAQLSTDQGGIQVISGPSGVGKTALAVHWAHQRQDRFPDGQLFVDLRGYDSSQEPVSPGTALRSLLRSLGVPANEQPDAIEDQTALYRSLLADRRVLVVLDDARDLRQVLPLLPPTGSAVITSRQMLSDVVAYTGARLTSLPLLTDTESEVLLRGMLDPGAAPGTPGRALDPDTVAGLVKLCGGLPLALRIAAANMVVNPHASIAPTVDELTEGDILAAFDASYRALPDEARLMFRRLAVVPGPDFDAASAGVVAGIPTEEAARQLKVLAAAHLVERGAAKRYRFHSLIRSYALRLTAADPDAERADAWCRLVEHYLDIVVRSPLANSSSSLRLPRDEMPARRSAVGRTDELDIELPNVVAGALRAAEIGPYPLVWLFADYLCTYFHRNARRAEWFEIAEKFLRAAREQEALDVQALLHRSIGTTQLRAGRYAEAFIHLAQAVRTARECGWGECEASAQLDLAGTLMWSGNPAEAATYSRRAVAIFAELGSVVGENRALRTLGSSHHFQGDLDGAEENYRRALVLSEQHDLDLAQAIDLRAFGCLFIDRDRLGAAEAMLARARDLYAKVGSVSGLARIHLDLSLLRYRRGDLTAAREEAGKALELVSDRGILLLETTIRVRFADAASALGDHADAERQLELAMGLGAGEHDYPWHRAETLAAFSRLDARRGRYAEAVRHAQRARRLARRHGYRLVELGATTTLVDAYLGAAEPDLAVATARDALELGQGIDPNLRLPRIQEVLAGRI